MENKKAPREEPINNQQENRHQQEGAEKKGAMVKPKAELYCYPADGRPMPNVVTDNKSDGDAQKPVEDATLNHFNTDKRKHDDQVEGGGDAI